MSVQDLNYIKSEMINDDSMNNSMYTFHIENIPFRDEKEDACTQTYACPVTNSAQESPNLGMPYYESEETDMTDLSYYETSPFLFSPTTRRATNQYYKDKTPKTMKMLKEKHRENERLRHHSLNQHLRLICRKVPGSAENGKETKVVMMQRIISYVAYLENTIRSMCSQLDLKPNPAWLKLTSSVKDMEKSGTWRKEFLAVRSEDSRDSEIFSRNVTRRLTLSSPAVITDVSTRNSTPDIKPPKSKVDSYQDNSAPTSSLEKDESISSGYQWLMPAEEVVIDGSENFDALLNNSEYDHMFELPSSTFESRLMKSPDEVKWLGSPDKSPTHLQGKTYSHYGIKCDPRYFDEQPYELSHTVAVSPDQVIPQTAIKQEVVEEDEASAISSGLSISFPKRIVTQKTRHRQSSPRRAPLLNITNWSDISLELSEELFDSKDWHCKQEESGTDVAVSNSMEVATSKLNGMTKTTTSSGTNDVMAVHKLETEQDKKLNGALPGDMTMKLDLRKSSWMNGFMMYSHIHRKQLIKENPGLHVSAISKMMGHTWRGMTSEQQHPYRISYRGSSDDIFMLSSLEDCFG